MSSVVPGSVVPKVSVIVPARNAARTIRTCLDSVLAQEVGDWELLVVDNGSEDETLEIVEGLARADSRIRILHEAKRGVSAARNRGIREAKGHRLLFLDADDFIEPAHLRHLLGALEGASGSDVAFCAVRRTNDAGALLRDEWNQDLIGHAFEILSRECAVCVHALLVERECIVEVGCFDESLQTCEDWDLWQRIARMGGRWTGVPIPLATYRSHPGSLSTRFQSLAYDGLEVIARGHRADPRVKRPDPRFKDGNQDFERRDQACRDLMFWSSFLMASAGQGASPFIDRLEALPGISFTIPDLVPHFILGLVIGVCRPADQLLDGWAEVWTRFKPFIDEMGTRIAGAAGPGWLTRELELELLSHDRMSEPRTLTRCIGRRVDLESLQAIVPPQGVDTLHLRICSQGKELRRLVMPLLGPLSALDLTQVIAGEIDPLTLSRGLDGFMRVHYWMTRGAQALSTKLRAAQVASPSAAAPPSGALRKLKRNVKGTLKRALARRGGAVGELLRPWADERFDWPRRWISPVWDAALSELPPSAPPVPPAASGEDDKQHAPSITDDRKAFWEGFFTTPDPWHYGTPYEQLKYRRTMSLVPDGVGRALELACAEGRFSAMLAPKVGHLTATDIAATAVERAGERCRGIPNLDLRTLDFVSDTLPADLDLLVCSEVLYYLHDREQLTAVAKKFSAALKPGGRLLSTHVFLTTDVQDQSAFDWGSPFGSTTIRETFAATEGLALERSLIADIYRIDLFRRLAPGEPPPVPTIESVPLESPMEPDVERWMIPGGAILTRAQALLRAPSDLVPVLMYHRVAQDGPASLARYRVTPRQFEEQLTLLRRHGYRTIDSEELVQHMWQREAVPGRPILITFDDAYTDFHDAAWPILQRRDFTAEVFVVTDKVGGCADWDTSHGTPAPIMSWKQIVDLKQRGVKFGSHLRTHRAADSLDSVDLLMETAGSRALLEAQLGVGVRSVANPFGIGGERVVRAEKLSGYEAGFTTENGYASVRGDPSRIPRIEVRGDWTIDAFAAALGIRTAPAGVSVIVMALDDGSGLDDTLRSVRAQTHRAMDIVVVVRDDAAGPADVARRHAAEDPRLRVLGVSGTPAQALRDAIAATGDPYLAFLRAGDLWHPHKVERQVRVLEGKADAGLVYTWFETIDGKGGVLGTAYPEEEGELAWRMCEDDILRNPASVMVRREALKAGDVEALAGAVESDRSAFRGLWLHVAREHRIVVIGDVLAASPARKVGAAQVQRLVAEHERFVEHFRPFVPAYAWAFERSRDRLLRQIAMQCADAGGYAACAALALRLPGELRSDFLKALRKITRGRVKESARTTLQQVRGTARPAGSVVSAAAFPDPA